jgi:hypothetical protein
MKRKKRSAKPAKPKAKGMTLKSVWRPAPLVKIFRMK